jgi:membrane-associated protein
VVGQRAFTLNVRFLDRAALLRTHMFYERHGGKALVLCRFMPVLRTFAPFVAGAASMDASRFQFFNVAGALLWVVLLVGCGYLFGNIPMIRNHLNTIVLVGLAAAVVPVLLGVAVKLARRRS